jgi:hypothetical protein
LIGGESLSISARESFLLEFYNNVWLNVRRAETSLWVLFPFYFTALSGLFIYRIQIGDFMTSFFILVISIFFSIISFNLNLWFVRNMRLVSRAEREFLNPNDFNRIIPKRWVTDHVHFFNYEPYCLLSIAYLAIGIVTTILMVFYVIKEPFTREQNIILLLMWGFLLLGETYFVRIFRSRYLQTIAETQ